MADTKVEEVKVEEVVDATQAPDDGHLIVELSQENYDDVMALAKRGGERGISDSFQYWLRRAIEVGCKTITRPWDDRDVVTLFNKATRGDSEAAAKLARLIKLDGKK
jgi:hypothetical protein